jgi:hypothetical protein
MSLGKKISERRSKQPRVIQVPEWGEGDTPLKMYVYPITAGDLNKIQKKHKDFLSNMTIDGMVDLIILKAGDEDGNRLFTLEDKVYLMAESVTVISEIAANMFGEIESLEDAEKN